MKDNVKEAVPFLWVSDLEASIRYYGEGLGFTMRHRWEPGGKLRWCWLALGGASLMLQQRRGPPDGKSGEGVNLYFICDDALAIYDEALAGGLEPSEPEVGNGMWVTGLVDPDGFQLFFESPTETPEETRLSEVRR
jgi:catechol 2,3-dioxygenase-like lactoylglutathione lyase family enzyme